MRPYECGTDKAEQKWLAWLSACEKLVGNSLADIKAHSDYFDLYSDGCTPVEAVAEIRAQGALA